MFWYSNYLQITKHFLFFLQITKYQILKVINIFSYTIYKQEPLM